MRWTVVIPTKALPQAKSRLLPASMDPAGHNRLVRAIRTDTVAAARSANGVARILVVTDRSQADVSAEWPHEAVLVQSSAGLNPALYEAAEHASTNWPDNGVATLVGDLPALHPDDLAAALALAAKYARAHVPDREGTGTTLLTARPGVELAPAFGPGSSARHAAGGAVTLDVAAGLRTDVDTAADLQAAAALGVGPATAAVLADRLSPVVQLEAR